MDSRMICRNCGREIQPANSFLASVKYRHSEDQMITCVGEGGFAIKDETGKYAIAEPEEEN